MSLNLPRRVSRKMATENEIDIRRARGELSCAECRRLKLRCDRKIPCSSCVRRGCQSICPNGRLTGQGARSVTSTSRLHVTIGEMGQRIRLLEEALAIFQSGVSDETHPLLREEFLSIKLGLNQEQVPETGEANHDGSTESINTLGTLTIDEHGQVTYSGRSTGSEALLLASGEMDNPASSITSSQTPLLSNETQQLSDIFPFGVEGNHEKSLDALFSHLPSQPRAWALCEAYMEHVAWVFRPIKRDEIIDEFFTPIYRSLRERRATMSPGPHTTFPHQLAVLYLIFALGALVDLTLEPYNAESEAYYQCARACLSLHSIFEYPEISTVHAVLLMAKYRALGGRKFTLDSSWSFMSLGCKLAQSIGLHRDSARFGLDSKTVQRRRALFWELFSHESFYSLATGRPPAILLPYIDCEFPMDDEATLDDDGRVLIGFFQWKYEFTKEILSAVTTLTLTAEPPSYQTILDLDRKVREKTLPPHLNVFLNPEDEHFTPSAYMRGCLLGQYRTVSLLYIHRSFFAQAMLDHPINPLRSPYAPSFLAAYRCASGVIKSNLNHFARFPDLCCRWWNIWTHLFSATVIVGTIVTRSPGSSMSPSAFIELGLACDLFEKAAMRNYRARDSLAILRKLRMEASSVYTHFRSGSVLPSTVLSVGNPDYGDDELALFGGETRVLVNRLVGKSKDAGYPTPSANLGAANLDNGAFISDIPGSQEEPTPDVHPALVEYLLNVPSDYPHRSGSQDVSTLDSGYYTAYGPSQGAMYLSPKADARVQTNWPSTVPFIASPDAQASSLSPAAPLQSSNSATSISPVNLVDFGMMMTGDSGIDEQWMYFIRDSGLLEGSSTRHEFSGFT